MLRNSVRKLIFEVAFCAGKIPFYFLRLCSSLVQFRWWGGVLWWSTLRRMLWKTSTLGCMWCGYGCLLCYSNYFREFFYPKEKMFSFEVFLMISTLELHCLLKNQCLRFSLMWGKCVCLLHYWALIYTIADMCHAKVQKCTMLSSDQRQQGVTKSIETSKATGVWNILIGPCVLVLSRVKSV